MSSEKVNPIKDQFTLSPTMSNIDAPPPPYSSLYPMGYGPPPTIPMNPAIPMSSFYPPTQNGGLGPAAIPPPPPQLIAPQPLLGTGGGHHASSIGGGSHHQHALYHHPLSIHQPPPPPSHHHYIPTAATANHHQPFLYQTATALVPTAYGPMLAPVQFPPNSPPGMIIPQDCFDPRAPLQRFDDFGAARGQTIPIPPYGIIPQANMAMMYGMNNAGTAAAAAAAAMLASKPKKPYF